VPTDIQEFARGVGMIDTSHAPTGKGEVYCAKISSNRAVMKLGNPCPVANHAQNGQSMILFDCGDDTQGNSDAQVTIKDASASSSVAANRSTTAMPQSVDKQNSFQNPLVLRFSITSAHGPRSI